MNPVILIPTFFATQRASRTQSSILTNYDHATPITQNGELGRCLESLRKVEDLGLIVILVAADSSLQSRALGKVRETAAAFPDLGILIVGAPELASVRERLTQVCGSPFEEEIALEGYGAIRNLGLVMADILGFDAVVFVDDDEVVDDPEFLKRAMYGLGKLTKSGIPILAKTGYYLNEEGSYLSKQGTKWYDHYWQQGRAFNKWITSAMRGPRLSRSNHVCGGCLAIHKEAFRRLAFDPWIPRGEDLDYMLDLRMYGSDIWFDNTWVLRHLSPKSMSEGDRFRQDIFRWIYEYRKLEYSQALIDLQQVRPASLEPYPGPFLEPGLTKRIQRTARLRSLGRSDRKAYRRAARAATGEASLYAEQNCANYFEFQYSWPDIMSHLDCDQELAAALVRTSVLREAGGAVSSGGGTGTGNAVAADGGAGTGNGVAAGGGTGTGNAVAASSDAGNNAGAGNRAAVGGARVPSIDPGATSEIRLNIAE